MEILFVALVCIFAVVSNTLGLNFTSIGSKVINGETGISETSRSSQYLCEIVSKKRIAVGAFISELRVLTVAHPLYTHSILFGNKWQQRKVKTLKVIIEDYVSFPAGVTNEYHIETINVHSDYKAPEYGHDIAVLKLFENPRHSLEGPFPIPIPRGFNIGEDCVLLSFNQCSNWSSTLLLQARVIVSRVNNAKCQKMVQRKLQIDTRYICGISQTATIVEKEDIGSPLFCGGMIVGLYIFGRSHQKEPDLFTNVQEFSEYIDTIK